LNKIATFEAHQIFSCSIAQIPLVGAI